MKIYFFIIPSGNSTTTYSNKLFVEALQKMGYDVEIIVDINKKNYILNYPDCQVIFFQKTIQCFAHTKAAIKHLKGRVHLIHIDDDFQDMEDQAHVETLEISDLILVGTQKHKDALREYTTTPVEVISCMLDFKNYSYVPINQRKNESLIISWQQACADAYINDLKMIEAPIVNMHRLYEVRLQLYGWHMGKDYPDMSFAAKKMFPFAELIAYQPMDKYFSDIVPQIAATDIFVMPYDMSIKERWGKGGFGLKRIMLLGIPIIASDTEHHRTLIENGFNGFLAATKEEWQKALEKLIGSKDLRQQFSWHSRKRMESSYHDEAVIRSFLEAVHRHIKFS